jgi:hypothetical protein
MSRCQKFEYFDCGCSRASEALSAITSIHILKWTYCEIPTNLFDSKPRIWTTIWRENCASRFETKNAVKFTLKVYLVLIYFRLFSVDYISWFSIERARGRQTDPAPSDLETQQKVSWHEEIELNFDASCQQVRGLESEILWEARSTPTLVVHLFLRKNVFISF